jgi:type IV pilus assembly protein PilO
MEISLTKLPWYAQVGAFVALAGVGLGAFYYYYEQPARADMAARTTQLVALKADIIKGHETERQLPQFRSQVADLQGRLESLKSVLPDEKDAADLLRRLQTVATQSRLTIKSFKPAATVMKQLHAEWPIVLELDGTYHNLALFFDRVGRFTRIVNVSALDIKGKDKPDPNSTITATCVATTFVLLDKPNLPKKAPAKPGQPAGRGV